jgi:anti-anti-sigma factor
MEVNLVVIEGRPQGAVIPLKAKQFVIGREAGCQLRPKSPTVSNRHCAILQRDDHVAVLDLGSSNGTLVNYRCLRRGEEMRVSDGDRLQVGQLIFTVRIVAATREAEPTFQDWLMPSDEMSPQDVNSRTLPLSALSPTDRVADLATSERAPLPNPEAPTRFIFRRFDSVHRVASIGLSQAQLNGHEAIRALRKSLFGLASNSKCRRLVLDMAAVEALPSAACALLLALANRWEDVGGAVRLCALDPEVKRLIVALRLPKRIAVFEDCDQAISEPWE